VLVSAFIFGGIPEKAIKKALNPRRREENHPGSIKSINFWVGFLRDKDNHCLSPNEDIDLQRPADNMLLECCFESRADILISGDRDLVDIKALPFHLKILTPRKFLEQKL
jgi:predicted nucleic acid-binding protein